MLSLNLLTVDCTPPNYTLFSFLRTSKSTSSPAAVGGGTGFLIREPLTQLPTSLSEFSSESSAVALKLPHSKISVFNIYPHSQNLCLFFLMNLILFSLLLLPHLMNSSLLVILTSTLIIFLITLPLSFFLFCRHLT